MRGSPYSTTSIGGFAFAGCTALVSVNLGRAVDTDIESVFEGCISLVSFEVSAENTVFDSVNGVLFSKDCSTLISYPSEKACDSYEIPDSVRIIGDHAFDNNSHIISVTLPDSVETVGFSAFRGCTSLVSVTFGKSLGSIKGSAFSGCISLSSVSIPDSVKSIGAYAFRDCTSLTSVDLSNSLTSIEAGAFYNCSGLASAAIPCSVTSVGNYAFYGCTSLTALSLPEALGSIGSSAFSGCTSLTSVSLPDSVKSLGTNAFSGCTSLASLDLGNSVVSVGRSAFKGCTSLTTLKFPGSITSIGDSAFDGKFYDLNGETELELTFENLAGHTFNNVDGEWMKQASAPSEDSDTVSGECGDDASYELDPSTGTLTISGSGRMMSYSDGGTPWYSVKDSIKSINVAGSVSTIGDHAFEGCASLTSITISDSVTSIADSAFPGKFYDTDGGSEILQTADNLAGSTFVKIDGKWIKQDSDPFPDLSQSPSDTGSVAGPTMTYLFIALVIIINLSATAVIVRGRHA